MEHTRKIWKYINDARQWQHGGTITEVKVNVNGHWTHKYKQSVVEVAVVDNNRKRILLTYVTTLMDGGPLHKYLGALIDTTSAYKSL